MLIYTGITHPHLTARLARTTLRTGVPADVPRPTTSEAPCRNGGSDVAESATRSDSGRTGGDGRKSTAAGIEPPTPAV